MFSQRSREGYLLIDHQASPGLTPEEAIKAGLDPSQAAGGKMLEMATLTCAHCKVVVMKNPLRKRERPHCFKCNHYICDVCDLETRSPDYVHTPFTKLVDDGLTRLAHASNDFGSANFALLSTTQ